MQVEELREKKLELELGILDLLLKFTKETGIVPTNVRAESVGITTYAGESKNTCQRPVEVTIEL